MGKQVVHSPHLPPAKGPYSPGVRVGDLLFVSGMGPLDPATGAVISGDFAAMVHRTLDNIALVLAAAGVGMDRVVKTTVYLADLGRFAEMNEIYAGYFPGVPPARTTIQAARLPLDIPIEIEAIAYLG
jgi:2-iminobutanoate/2-iminopropanoate deaminase